MRYRFNEIVAALIAFGLTLAYASVSWSVLESRLLGRKRSRNQPEMASAWAEPGEP